MTNFRSTSRELRNWISPRREICHLARTWLYTTDMGRMGMLRVMGAGSKDIQRYSRPLLDVLPLFMSKSLSPLKGTADIPGEIQIQNISSSG